MSSVSDEAMIECAFSTEHLAVTKITPHEILELARRRFWQRDEGFTLATSGSSKMRTWQESGTGPEYSVHGEGRMDKVNLAQKFSLFSEHYNPKIVGEVNDAYVKLAKLQGDFMWHHHEVEDELFLVVKGALRMKIRENGDEREVVIHPGEFIIIPHGVEHFPSADEETHILLLEPKSTLNTGNLKNGRTRAELQRI